MSTQTITSAIVSGDTIEVRPFYDGAITCHVLLNGAVIGTVYTNHMDGRRAQVHTFVDQAAAVEAVVSYHRRGWWTGEI